MVTAANQPPRALTGSTATWRRHPAPPRQRPDGDAVAAALALQHATPTAPPVHAPLPRHVRLVELDRWLHARLAERVVRSDGPTPCSTQVTVQAVTELCNARNAARPPRPGPARARSGCRCRCRCSLQGRGPRRRQGQGQEQRARGDVGHRRSRAAGPRGATPPLWQQGSSGSSGALPEGVGVLRTASLPESAMGVPRRESEGMGDGGRGGRARTPPEAHVFFSTGAPSCGA